IADILRLLRAQTVDPGDVIVRRGDPAHSMYFIAAGEVDIDLGSKRVRLGVGHFFGEVAVLRRARRSASVIAVTRTSLLALSAADEGRGAAGRGFGGGGGGRAADRRGYQ